MKNIKRVIIVFLIIMIISMLYNVFAKDNTIVSILNIDTNLEQTFYIEEEKIHIEGWKLATQENTKLIVYLDGKEIDNNCIKYSYKYDLISIVKGYGTYKENPLPNFDIDISLKEINVGKHNLQIIFMTENDNRILKSIKKDKLVRNNKQHILNIDSPSNGNTFYKSGIKVDGWKLATEKDTKLVALVDEKEINKTDVNMYYAYDLISIIRGYGTYEENPFPNFTITIPTEEIQQGKHKLKIQFKTSDDVLLEEKEIEIIVDKNIKHTLNVDTPSNNEQFDKYGINISGWKLSTEKNTKIDILLDNKEIDNLDVRYSYKYDLISIVKGYGTYEENPLPMFDINIPIDQISQGKHKIKIQFKTADGVLLDETERTVIIDKAIKHILNIDTVLSEQVWSPNGIEINGWKLANIPDTKLKVYIENKEIENLSIEYSYKYDLISIVKGYGTYKENPTPNFKIVIPVTEFGSGDNEIEIKMISEQGDVLEEAKSTIPEYKTQICIDTIYDRTTITNETQFLGGWVMTTVPNTRVRVLIDGNYRNEDVTRYERQDVINAISGYGNNGTNSQPGFGCNIDFSKFNLGLHQIAIRVEENNGKIVGEQVIYIFLRQSVIYEQGTFGDSGLVRAGNPYGSKLQYYRYGNGPNVFFATFTVHGFEDNWDHDGEALVNIANKFYEELKTKHRQNFELADKWTIYILPEINPDGRRYGNDNNGAGRTTLYSQAPNNQGIDLNRCWKSTGFRANEKARNYAGTAPYQAYEAQALRDFLISHKSQNGQTILVDLHGWLEQLIGDRQVGMYYAVQFPNAHGRSLDRYGDGYIIDWARTALASNGRLAKTSLIELPRNVYSNRDVENQRLAERYIQATLSMLHGII